MHDAVIVGAGLTGLTAAQALEQIGWRVCVVEKARGPGGRMSTRRDGSRRFDHGAQYFTARDPDFQRAVAGWQGDGHVARWKPRLAVIDDHGIVPKHSSPVRFVGVPGMNGVCRTIAAELRDCRYGWHVQSVMPARDGAWQIDSTDGEALRAPRLLITSPPEQIEALVGGLASADSLMRLKQVGMRPCWALLAEFSKPLLAQYDAAFVNEGPFSWVCAQRPRPGRPAHEAWVLHATPGWSEQHLEVSPARVLEQLWDAAQQLPGVAADAQLIAATVHRWRYAIARHPLEEGALELHGAKLLAAGDWACGSRVEGAWLSGRAAAHRWQIREG